MKIVIPPGHCKWWAVNPAIVLYVDSIIMPSNEFEKIYEGRNQNTYHRVVYKSVTLLKEEGILITSDSYFQKDEKILSNFKKQVRDIIQECDKKKLLQVVKDLRFAYEYWIAYNRKKLEILDKSLKKDYKYFEVILKDMNVWEEDLKFLREIEYLLVKNEKDIGPKKIDKLNVIFNVTFSNILTHVYLMLENAKLHQGSAFESLREYEPFFKYIALDLENISSLNNQILGDSLVVNFPIVGIKQKDFLQEITNTVGAYLKIRQILKRFEDIGWDLWEISERYNIDELNINKEILKRIREKVSSYKRIENKLEILDVISIMLGVLGSVSIPFNQIISGMSLFLAFGTKTIAESLKFRNVKNALKTMNMVKSKVGFKNLSVYFSLLDGVIIPTFLSKKEKLLSKDDDFIKAYIPIHWKRSDEKE